MKLRVTVNGNAYDVEVDILDDGGMGAMPQPVRPAPVAAAAPRPVAAPAAPAAAPSLPAGANALNSPIPGTVVEIKVKPGQTVAHNETVMIIDAMKMNTPIAAPAAATVKEILVKSGDSVKMGQPLIVFE